MSKFFGGIILLLAVSSGVQAQLKQLTMEDAILNVNTKLAPDNLSQLGWIKNTNSYYYVDNRLSDPILFTGDDGLVRDEKLIALSEINEKLRRQNADTLTKFPVIEWKSENTFAFFIGKKEFEYDKTKFGLYNTRILEIPDSAERKDTEPLTKRIAYTIANNLFIYDKGKITQVTHETNENVLCGTSVHRDEFGITKGTFWSPQGSKLAFYRMDQTMVADYPIVNWKTRPATVRMIKYPMAGGTSHQVTVGVFDVATGKTVFLNTGEPKDQYLTNISWSPDEKYVYVAVLNRDQNHMKLNRYFVSTGELDKTLFEEKDDKYVEPLNPVLFVPGNDKEFIWQSQRDGYNHLYLYNTDGKLIRQLTKGEFVVTALKGFDKKGERLYYMCTALSPLDRDLYYVTLADGRMKRVSGDSGMHDCFYNPFNNEVLDVYSNVKTPRKIKLIMPNGSDAKTLLNAENPLSGYDLGELKISSIKGKSGDVLYTRMYLPPNMDSTRKYPVIIYVYGGPHLQLITNSWQGGQRDLWFYYLAQQDFIVFSLDNRGSYNRGKKFEQAIFRNCGNAEMEDQLTGVEYLKSLPYIDTTRIGVDGWSYGGFMTISLMTRNPGVFKVAVAGGPVIDWSMYEIMYGERYMDTPQSNPEGFEKSNLLNYVKNLKGKLMLIHGTDDDVVVWQHSILYLKKAVDENKQVDYFVYPGHPHNVRGKDRVHLMNKITDYFKQNL
ncbi:MAG: Prolyl tripeptidyl peptidase precursor [Bacteroidetes bacterium ADurb.Bin141]|nr:MAG: Prolyl tripeptidyl peptidase precursor [Bacteroidetes bacterium ADurb.Bin141]